VDERRLLTALALSVLVIVAFQALNPAPRRHKQQQPTVAEAGVSTPPPLVSPAAATSAGPPSPPEIASKSDTDERRIDVDTRDLSVGFTNRGARVLVWGLTQYRNANGRPEDMAQVSPGGTHPLDVETGDAAVDQRIREALFTSSTQQLTVALGEEKALRFEYAGGNLEVQKTLTFHGKGYLVGVAVSVRRGGVDVPTKVVWGPGVGNATEAERQVRGYKEPSGVVLAGAQVEHSASAIDIKEAVRYPDVHWIGVDGRYFAALWVAPSGHLSGEIRQGALAPGAGGETRVGVVAAAGVGPVETVLLYVGPKEYRQLAALDHELARVVNVGEWWFFRQIVVGLMDLLRWLHARINNYGWSVIALTLLINLVMAPLRQYGIVNSVKMAKMSPEMKVIQERYRKYSALDPKKQEMQKEMAALYERHGMNMGTQMMMGCFPMLLTMPFLYAIYRVLDVSIELRGAEFLWIPDLSHRDPLFVTPLLMAISMFISQRTMPTSMDPAQQRMMMVMPVVFVVIFINMPAGLNLYWFASNVCTILQQTITLRVLKSREVAERERRRR
jgi:YidC/Oxa1 family membrane protein insertase